MDIHLIYLRALSFRSSMMTLKRFKKSLYNRNKALNNTSQFLIQIFQRAVAEATDPVVDLEVHVAILKVQLVVKTLTALQHHLAVSVKMIKIRNSDYRLYSIC